MELRHLKYFTAVAEEENVTRAAARLHVAQPALSRQIRDLEGELGVELFEHGARSLRLTEAGRLFLKEAKLVLAQMDHAVRTVRDFAQGGLGELHVGYAPSLTTKLLPGALRRFQELCPRVQVQLHDLSTEGMLAGLRQNTLHAAFVVKPSSTAATEGLRYQELRRFRPCAALAFTDPRANQKSLSPAELAARPLVGYTRADYPEYHRWLDRIFQQIPTAPRFVAEYDSSTSLIAAVEAGTGAALVQEGFEELAGSRVVLRPLSGRPPAFSFGVAWRKNDATIATRHFVEAALATAER